MEIIVDVLLHHLRMQIVQCRSRHEWKKIHFIYSPNGFLDVNNDHGIDEINLTTQAVNTELIFNYYCRFSADLRKVDENNFPLDWSQYQLVYLFIYDKLCSR